MYLSKTKWKPGEFWLLTESYLNQWIWINKQSNSPWYQIILTDLSLNEWSLNVRVWRMNVCCVGELYMIVEFCLYGNLQKFILANRLHFINQINPDTGTLHSTRSTQTQVLFTQPDQPRHRYSSLRLQDYWILRGQLLKTLHTCFI